MAALPGQDSNIAENDHLNAAAFQRIYPNQYFAKFLEQSVRPDGRPLARARPINIGLGVVTTADASALVKIGDSTALAGIKCEVMTADVDHPDQGVLNIEVEMPPMCSVHCRPGRPSDKAGVLADQLHGLLLGGTPAHNNIVDLKQLCIDTGKAAWAVYLDVYVLNDDGALLDCCLIAAVAALQTLRLPKVVVDESGNVVLEKDDGEEGQSSTNTRVVEPLQLNTTPIGLTFGFYNEKLLIDTTAEEEEMIRSNGVIVVSHEGEILKLVGSGNLSGLDGLLLQQCHEAGKARAKDVYGILRKAVDEYLNTCAAMDS